MDKFVERTYRFNEIGETPKGTYRQNLSAALSLIKSELSELEANLAKFEVVSETDCDKTKDRLVAAMMDDVADIIVTAVGFAYRLDMSEIQLNAILSIVAQANLNKFPSTVEEAEQSVQAYQNDERYENVSYKKVADDVYVVFGSPKGTTNYKILKKAGWVDPQERIERVCDL